MNMHRRVVIAVLMVVTTCLFLSGCTVSTAPSSPSANNSTVVGSATITISAPAPITITTPPSQTPTTDVKVVGLDGTPSAPATPAKAPDKKEKDDADKPKTVAQPPKPAPKPPKAPSRSSISDDFHKKIAASAKKLIGSHNFRGSDVSGGRLACAKVASTALKNAGAIDRVFLNVRDTVKALRNKGWKEVKPPPFKDGDVITWATYDYTGDGRIDDDSHIGIMVKDGGSYKAMNNSSTLRTPRLSDPYSIGRRVSRVLRKA